MSETVTICREVDVTVYRVKCTETDHEFDFDVHTDSDGDLIINVDTSGFSSSLDTDSVKDWADDNMEELLEASCYSGRVRAFNALLESLEGNLPKGAMETIKNLTEDL